MDCNNPQQNMKCPGAFDEIAGSHTADTSRYPNGESRVMTLDAISLQPQDLADVFNRSPLAPWIAQLHHERRLLLRKDFPLPPSYGDISIQGFVSEGRIHLIANNIPSRESVMAVLLHEVFHCHGEALIGSQAWERLMGELGEQLERASKIQNGNAGQWWAKAAARMAGAQAGGIPMSGMMAAEELGAYAIEEVEKASVTWRCWLKRQVGNGKLWALRTFGVQLGCLTPEQLHALAIAALKNCRTKQ